MRHYVALFVVLLAVCAPSFADAALQRTNLFAGRVNDTTGTIASTSPTVTVPANSLIVVSFGIIHGAPLGTTNVTNTGTALSWTRQLTTTGDGSGFYAVHEIWTAPVTGSESITITISNTASAGVHSWVFGHAVAYTGYDTADPIGGSVQDSDVRPPDTGAMTLSEAPTLNDVTIAANYQVPPGSTDPSSTPGAGWSELFETSSGSGYGTLEMQERTASTSAAVVWVDIDSGSAGEFLAFGTSIVIRAASAGSGGALSKPPNNLGLIGYWSFNEGTGSIATDFSGNGNHGTLTSSTIFPTWTSGKLGKALSFTGSSDNNVNLGDINATDGATRLTISAWIYQDSAVVSQAIVSKHAGVGSPNWHFGVADSGDGGADDMQCSPDGLPFYGGHSDSNVHKPGRWEHWVCVFDGTQTGDGNRLKMYFNGSAQALTFGGGGISAVTPTTADVVRIGAYSDLATVWSGKIDEVRIYSRALSATEIAGLYTSGAMKIGASSVDLQQGSSLASGLVGHWTFDGNDTQSTITDRSGSGYHGYFINGATSSAKVMGKLGQGFEFDGVDDYVSVPFPGGLSSVAFWMKADDTTSRDIVQLSPAAKIEIDATAEVVGPGGSTVYIDGSSASAAVDTNWRHVVVTGIVMGAANTLLGCSTAFCFDGKLDDVRFYNRDLTAAEIKQLYRLGVTKLSP